MPDDPNTVHSHACRDCGARFPCHGFHVWLEDRDATMVKICLAFDVPRGVDQCYACRAADPIVRSLEDLDRDPSEVGQ
jgi:hypothetical protein